MRVKKVFVETKEINIPGVCNYCHADINLYTPKMILTGA